MRQHEQTARMSENHIQELRLVITARDYERSKAFFQQLLGTGSLSSWESTEGRIVILEAGRATLEIVDETHAARIDDIEVGRRVSGDLRLALRFSDSAQAAQQAQALGAALTNPPVETPWNSRNARVIGPDGLQLTLFSGGA